MTSVKIFLFVEFEFLGFFHDVIVSGLVDFEELAVFDFIFEFRHCRKIQRILNLGEFDEEMKSNFVCFDFRRIYLTLKLVDSTS
jgi:hypothetical protein